MSELALPDTGLQLALDLQHAGALTAVSLDITDDMPIERYESLGSFLGSLKRSASWWIGDWLLFGEASYGERVSQAIEATGLAVETLTHYRNVCETVPKSRRRPGLSFGCHTLVRKMPPADQTKWLNRAEKNGWSEPEMKDAIREASDPQHGDQQTLDAVGSTARRVDKALVIEVGYAILRDAKEIDDGFVTIPIETYTRLRAALGAE